MDTNSFINQVKSYRKSSLDKALQLNSFANGGPVKPYAEVSPQIDITPITNEGVTIYPMIKSTDIGANYNRGNLSVGAGLSMNTAGGRWQAGQYSGKLAPEVNVTPYLTGGLDIGNITVGSSWDFKHTPSVNLRYTKKFDVGGPVPPFVTDDLNVYKKRKQAEIDSAQAHRYTKEFNEYFPGNLIDEDRARYMENKYLTPTDDYSQKIFAQKPDGNSITPMTFNNPRVGKMIELDYSSKVSDKEGYHQLQRVKPFPAPVQKVIYQEKPKTFNYEVSRDIQYPNTDDAQIWRILIGRNEYNLSPNAADFEQYKDPRYRSIPQPVTDSVRNAWNERFRMEPYTKEMTEEEATELEKQGYTVKKYANGGPTENVPTVDLPTATVTGKPSFLSPGWWNKTADKLDNFALAAGFVPVVGDAASFLADVGANFARYQYDKNDPTIPESQRKDIANANLKSGLGLAGIGALLGLAGTSVPSGAARKMLTKINKRAINSPLERVYNRFGYYKDIPDNVTVLKKAKNDDPRSYRQILNDTGAYDQLTPGNKFESNFITFRNTPGELIHNSIIPVDMYHPEYHSFREALNRGDIDFLNKKFPIVRDNAIEWQYKNGLYKPKIYNEYSLFDGKFFRKANDTANKNYRRFLYDAKDSGFDITDLSKVARNDASVMWIYPKLLSYNKDAANNLLKDEINGLLYPHNITNNWNGKNFRENYIDDFAPQIIRRDNRRKFIAGSVLGGMALSMPALADLYETIPTSMNGYTSRFDYTYPQQYPYLYSKFNNAVARNVFPNWMFDQKNRIDMLPRYTALLENGIISQEKFDETFKPASYESNNGYSGFVDTSKGLWNGFVNLSNSPLSNTSGEFLFNTYVPSNNEENKWTGNKEYFSNRSDIKDDDFVYLKDGRLYVSPLDSVPGDSTQVAHFPLQIKKPIDSFELDNNGRLRLRMKSGELYNPAAVNENWNNRKVVIGTRDGSSTVLGANLFNQIFEQNAIDSLNSLYKGKDIRMFVPDNGTYNGDRLFNGYHTMPSEQAFNIYLDKYALGGPVRQLQGGKESKVPLDTPYVFSEKAPEGYYPTIENDEGMYSPLVV